MYTLNRAEQTLGFHCVECEESYYRGHETEDEYAYLTCPGNNPKTDSVGCNEEYIELLDFDNLAGSEFHTQLIPHYIETLCNEITNLKKELQEIKNHLRTQNEDSTIS